MEYDIAYPIAMRGSHCSSNWFLFFLSRSAYVPDVILSKGIDIRSRIKIEDDESKLHHLLSRMARKFFPKWPDMFVHNTQPRVLSKDLTLYPLASSNPL